MAMILMMMTIVNDNHVVSPIMTAIITADLGSNEDGDVNDPPSAAAG